MTMKVFVGSTEEHKRAVQWLTKYIAENYSSDLQVRSWKASFRGGRLILDEILRAAEETDAAILFWSPDDVTASRDSTSVAPRDNLVFEAGIFTALHGTERTQLMIPSLETRTKVPSDLAGLVLNYYTWNKSEKNFENTALPAVADEVCNALIELGPRERRPQRPHLPTGLRNVEYVETLVGDPEVLMQQWLLTYFDAKLTKEIDLVFTYRVDEFVRHLEAFKQRPDAKLRACFADVWDQPLLDILRRKITRPEHHMREAVNSSIVKILGGNEDENVTAEKVVVSSSASSIAADYSVHLTPQRITYTYCRIDDHALIVPLDMKRRQDPRPMAWAVSRESSPIAFDYYKSDIDLMFAGASSVFKSK